MSPNIIRGVINIDINRCPNWPLFLLFALLFLGLAFMVVVPLYLEIRRTMGVRIGKKVFIGKSEEKARKKPVKIHPGKLVRITPLGENVSPEELHCQLAKGDEMLLTFKVWEQGGKEHFVFYLVVKAAT